MAISISKAFGKTRLTVSPGGVYGSVGLGGGVRVGTDLMDFSGSKSSRSDKPEEVIVQEGTPLVGKWMAWLIAVIVLCVIPVSLSYMFLWTWMAHTAAIILVLAALGSAIFVAKDHQ